MSRMKKKRIKAKKSKDIRTGTVTLTRKDNDGNPYIEEVKIHALTWYEVKQINRKHNVDRLGTKMSVYQEKLENKDLTEDTRFKYEELLAEYAADLYDAMDVAGTDKIFQMIDMPEGWLNTLSQEEVIVLKKKIDLWLMYIDLDELNSEILKIQRFVFSESKRNSTFTGEQVVEELMKIEQEYITLKKNPILLDSALRDVKQQTAEIVYKCQMTGQ